MKKTGNIYALIASAGDYKNTGSIDLPAYKADSRLICDALCQGLNVRKENIRIPGNEGYLTTSNLALCLKDFNGLSEKEDTFIFYFSGHGAGGNILLSDAGISLGSLIRYIDRMAAGSKLIFLDCCYAGDFTKPEIRKIQFGDTIDSFVGNGTAILASSCADQVSRSGTGGEYSLFTLFLATSLQSKRLIRQGMLSVNDVKNHVRYLMEKWSEIHPDKTQVPVFRSNICGDIRFKVSDDQPYRSVQISFETREYILCSVKSISSQIEKRLCAFIITKEASDHKTLARITKDVVRRIRYAEVHGNKIDENRYKGKPAQVVWCYFGGDESDIIRSVYYAYTIWARTPELRKKYFRHTNSSTLIKGVCIVDNESYDMIQRIQGAGDSGEPSPASIGSPINEAEISDRYDRLLMKTISMAEDYISDLHEVENHTLFPGDFYRRYETWSNDIRKLFLRMTDYPVPPVTIHEHTETIMSLVGWIVDIALMMERNQGKDQADEGNMWIIRNAVRGYYDDLEKLKNE